MILGNLLLTSRLKNITIYSAAELKYSIMLLKKGTLLQGGKYKIEKVLGQGGFGITYLATQINLNRNVAIKEFFMKDMCCREEDTNQVYYISSDRNFVDNFKNKFIKEAQTISSLNHRNIIRIHDTFEENGTAYYAMEYIDGCSISDILKQQGKLQEDVAIQYIKEVAEALNYIHSKHINHLDIKPSNIMVRQVDNSVVLIDFGVAKQYDLLTDEGTTSTPVGVSHGYSPLEQYSDGGVQNFSPQSDIYALGATLYTMVVGEKPPHAVSISQNGSPTIPNTISPNIRNAITAAMKLKRSERPQSVSSFVNILNDLDCNEETVVITKQKKSRRPIVLASTLLLLIAIIALSVFAWNQNKTEILALSSFSKSNQELVNEKVEQYKKEGKIILNKSDDPTGKEHYIVFADVKQQTIGVDTLGEKVQIIKLAEAKQKDFCLAYAQGTEPFTIYSMNTETKAANVRVVDSVTFKSIYDANTEEIMKVECYKDKYILMTCREDNYVRNKILFFKQPSVVFHLCDGAIEKTDGGDLNITITSSEMFGMTMLDQEFVQAIFHVTLNPDGLIKKQDDSVNFGGIMIPTRAYGNPEEMQEYLNRIENDREANFDRDLEKEEAFLKEWLLKHPECAGMSVCKQMERCHQDTGFDFDINGKACDMGE